jgi:hypothetical protein
VSTSVNLRYPHKAENFFTRSVTTSFLRRALVPRICSTAPIGTWPQCRGFKITLSHTTLGSTTLDEGSPRRRDLYLTVHNNHNRHLCHRRDSNNQSQQVRGFRHKPQTARTLGSATKELVMRIWNKTFKNTLKNVRKYEKWSLDKENERLCGIFGYRGLVKIRILRKVCTEQTRESFRSFEGSWWLRNFGNHLSTYRV